VRINVGDVTLWFDVSGPSILPVGGTVIERPTLVAVHGGPGSDHINMKAGLAPLADHFQIIYYDQRGHGRSDASTSEFWNLRTWARDRRALPWPRGWHHPGQHDRRALGLPAQRRNLPPPRWRRSSCRRGTRLR